MRKSEPIVSKDKQTDVHEDELQFTEKELNYCPVCNSDNISYEGHFNEGNQKVECGECLASWFEVWSYCGVTLIKRND